MICSRLLFLIDIIATLARSSILSQSTNEFAIATQSDHCRRDRDCTAAQDMYDDPFPLHAAMPAACDNLKGKGDTMIPCSSAAYTVDIVSLVIYDCFECSVMGQLHVPLW
jgi:hypothetical protein